MAPRLAALRIDSCLTAVVLLICLGCKAESPMPTEMKTVSESPLFGHAGLGGTVVESGVVGEAVASDTSDARQCMGDDAFESGLVPGMQSATDLRCASQDVVSLGATLLQYAFPNQPTIDYTGQQITCPVGGSIIVRFALNLAQVPTSPRTDIGIWIAKDGGDAITGTCAHYNLANVIGNSDGDQCGDLVPDAVVKAGYIETQLSCDQVNSGPMHVGSCIAWTDPSTNRACTVEGSIQDSRFGSLPGNKSKCNCAGFDLPISVGVI